MMLLNFVKCVAICGEALRGDCVFPEESYIQEREGDERSVVG